MRGWSFAFSFALALALALAACVRSKAVPCGRDAAGAPMYCADGAVCRELEATDGMPLYVCARPEQLGCTAGVACEVDGGAGTCHGDVCLPIACGNRLLDAGEGCDDGNAIDDDGCSQTCQLRVCGNAYVDPGEDCDDGNLLSHDGCSSTCANEVLEWELVAAAPPRTANAVAAHDPRRARTVLFDGPRGETFEWDGTVWTRARLLISGPSRRTGTAAAYDGTHVVVFGGSLGPLSPMALGDQWLWDGQRWQQRLGVGPGGRELHAMAYDAGRRRLVVFGGRSGQMFLGDTWQWDGAEWRRDTAAPSPGARAHHAMAYDPSRGAIVMFGGTSNGVTLATSTWVYDGAWRDVTPAGGSPPPRTGGALAYDPVRERVVLFGGRALGGQLLDDTWAWTGAAWTELSSGTRPQARRNAAIAGSHAGLVLATGAVAELGAGANDDVLADDTWTWDGAAWTRRSPTDPFAPHHAVHDHGRGRGVLIGAPSGTRELVDGRWATEHRGASPTTGAALAYDAARAVTVAFGGIAPNGQADATTWTWNGSAWTAHAPAIRPPPRRSATLAFDAGRGEVVMFGGAGYGETGDVIYGDTWTWNGTSWTQAAPGGPSPRTDAAAALDRARGEVIVFGGRDAANQYLGDTWRWKAGAWEALAVPGRSRARPRTWRGIRRAGGSCWSAGRSAPASVRSTRGSGTAARGSPSRRPASSRR